MINVCIKKHKPQRYIFYKTKKFTKKYNDVWGGIKNKIKEVSRGECD